MTEVEIEGKVADRHEKMMAAYDLLMEGGMIDEPARLRNRSKFLSFPP